MNHTHLRCTHHHCASPGTPLCLALSSPPRQLSTACPCGRGLSHCRHGGTYRHLRTLLRFKLVHHDANKYDGYRLTYMGYDFLAIRTLLARGHIAAVGRRIGVGKESDVFEVRGAAALSPGAVLSASSAPCRQLAGTLLRSLHWTVLAILTSGRQCYCGLWVLHQMGGPAGIEPALLTAHPAEGKPCVQLHFPALGAQ